MIDRSRREAPSTAALGAGFVVVGLALLAAQLLKVDVGRYGWPLFVIAPGLIVLVTALIGRAETWPAIAGSVVTVVGMVLLYQNSSDHWESWAYAWAIVVPGAVGLGMVLAGLRGGQASAVRSGAWLMFAGLGLFIAGVIFFEGIIGIGDRRLPLPDWSLAVLVIVIGVALLIWAAFARQDAGE